MAEINRIHVSPGIYASETVDMKAAASSIGITKLALVGETLKGPAFQPYWVHSPKEYASVFGGTSPKKFAGSNYPKYELPYIANEYLKKSTELCVVRTLGFSGYNAGPAWLITGESSANPTGKKYVIAVLRSRGDYKYRADMGKLSTDTGCPCDSAFDSLTYRVGELSSSVSCSAPISYNMDAVELDQYYSINYSGSDCTPYTFDGQGKVGFNATYGNFGRFTIKCIVGPSQDGESPSDSGVTESRIVSIPVSLNKSDKDYILNVLGSSNDDGDQPLFVESLYDVAWEDLVVNEGYDKVSAELAKFDVAYAADYGGLDPVTGILTKYETELKKKDVGKRYLYSTNVTNGSPEGMLYYVFDYDKNEPISITKGKKFTEEEARLSETEFEDGEAFEITDGEHRGQYINTSGKGAQLKELMTVVPLGNKPALAYSVKKISGVDTFKSAACEEGHIYTVTQIVDATGKKYYVYKAFDEEQAMSIENETERLAAMDQLLAMAETTEYSRRGSIVYNYEDGLYYKNGGTPIILSGVTITSDTKFIVMINGSGNLKVKGETSSMRLVECQSVPLGKDLEIRVKRNFDGSWKVTNNKYYKLYGVNSGIDYEAVIYQNENGRTVINNDVMPVLCDLNDYKSQFRYSSTPWVVSNAKGDANNIEVNKLFRFHTISDGSGSVSEVKVSIENIRPDSGEFDVIVRSYNDGDSNVNVLERFTRCTMTPGKNFIGYQIGTIDGTYESKSKFITVETNDSTAAKNSVPAGFIGYPIPVYDGSTVAGDDNSNVCIAPIAYNKNYDEDVAKRKQYFGISDRSGYDYDYFSFKGKMATLDDPYFVSHGFHLDCRMDKDSYNGTNAPKITVDGVEGYVFDTVSVNARTSSLSNTPIIASEADMEGSIFEDIKLRKFTMVFAGGFDGWDIYRDQRTNTDDFSATTYKGYINTSTGVGYSFDTHNDAGSYGIEGRAITSDYYSTLAGVSLLKNPEETDINLLATPGIDTINNTKLVEEVFNILEDRADTFYIVTTPDKESGSGDYAEDIQDVDETVSEFADKELFSDYTATYYPWVKIDDNGEYVWIPATRDVVRNLAESDNTNTTMNLAPAGTTRGKVDAIRARKNLKNGESDELYEANINPVRTYAQEGLVIMGQKTLRQEDDLLNRVDVRRMVLRMRKLIAIGCLGLIFEPNDNSTVRAFRSIISGIMQSFIDNRAIEKWTMDVDDSQEARDRLELGATIYIKPIRALEYITLNFVVTNNDVYFEN